MAEDQRLGGEEPEETGNGRPAAEPDDAQGANDFGDAVPANDLDETAAMEGAPAAGETQIVGAERDEDLIRAAWPGGDEATQIVGGDDDATRIVPRPTDGTQIMPPVDTPPAWAGRAGVPEPEAYPPLRGATAPRYQQPPPPPPVTGRTWWTPLLLGLLALGLVGIVVLAAWLMTRDRAEEPAASPTPSLATTAPPTPTASPTPTAASPTASPVQLVQIPAALIGLSQDEAAKRLGELGLFWSFDYQASDEPANTVIATRPGPGELVALGSTVTLVVAIDQPPSPSPSPSPSTTAGGGG